MKMATLREVQWVLGLLTRSSGSYRTHSSWLRRGLNMWSPIPTHCCCLSPTEQLLAGHIHRPYTSPAVQYNRPLSPAVRHIVDSHNINDLSAITATGPGQRLLKGYSCITLTVTYTLTLHTYLCIPNQP